MAFLRVMLVLSAIAMSVVSFPTETSEEKKLHTEEITDSTIQHTLQPIAQPAENDDSKEKISLVEFVIKSDDENSTAEPGKDNEKYTITNISTEKNISEDKEAEDFNDNENFNKKNIEKPNSLSTSDGEEKYGIFTDEDSGSLSPIEPLLITPSRPKYYFRIYVPNPPFPEISREPKLKETSYITDENSENAKPFIMPKKVPQHPYPAGPVLYPESIYNREFSVPFFE